MKYTSIVPAVTQVVAHYENDDGSDSGTVEVILWALNTDGEIVGLVIVDEVLVAAGDIDGFTGYQVI